MLAIYRGEGEREEEEPLCVRVCVRERRREREKERKKKTLRNFSDQWKSDGINWNVECLCHLNNKK